jgi:hypothetical protein
LTFLHSIFFCTATYWAPLELRLHACNYNMYMWILHQISTAIHWASMSWFLVQYVSQKPQIFFSRRLLSLYTLLCFHPLACTPGPKDTVQYLASSRPGKCPCRIPVIHNFFPQTFARSRFSLQAWSVIYRRASTLQELVTKAKKNSLSKHPAWSSW